MEQSLEKRFYTAHPAPGNNSDWVLSATFLGFYRWNNKSRTFKRKSWEEIHQPKYRPRYVGIRIKNSANYTMALVYRIDADEFKGWIYQEYSGYDAKRLTPTRRASSEIINLDHIGKALREHLAVM
jgi:hypothetical protein